MANVRAQILNFTNFKRKKMAVILFHYQKKIKIKEVKKLKRLIQIILKEHSSRLDRINVIFCSDEYVLELNKKFLLHDYYTDTLSFSLNEGKSQTGEIYVSIERIKENAKKFNVVFMDELLRVVIHSVLHLCGFKDKKKNEFKAMRKMEDSYLKRYGKL